MIRKIWRDKIAALIAHPTALPILATAMAALLPILTLLYILCLNFGRDGMFLNPGLWLWTGFYSALLMLRFGGQWPMSYRGILVLLLSLDGLVIAISLLVSTMAGLVGVLLMLFATLTPFLPLGLLFSLIFG